MKSLEERRRCKRYKGREDKAAYVAVRPTFQKIGNVKDISMGGLGFTYILTGNHRPLLEEETPINIDLFVSGNGFYLSQLQCKLAYDVLEENRMCTSSADMQSRKCGVAFENLTAAQKDQIQLFLADYTMDTC